MKTPLRRLLSRVIDYAGMFPPARHSLPEAWRNYVENGRTACAFMQRRFVCPAAGLVELAREIEASRPAAVEIAAVSRLPPGGDAAAAAKNEIKLLTQLSNRMRTSGIALDLSWELAVDWDASLAQPRVPGAPAEVSELSILLDDVTRQLRSEKLHVAELFVELPMREDEIDPPMRLTPAVERLAYRLHNCDNLLPRWSLKFRTGGPTARDVPSPQLLAGCIELCRGGRSAAFKCTAGLHHALRHYDAALGVWQHGFINVLVASVLSSAQQLPAPVLEELLQETSPAAFTFTDTELRWREHSATPAELDQARSRLMISFGSCSFDEPCQDLRDLAWL